MPADSRSPRLTMKSRVRGVSSLRTARLCSSAVELVEGAVDLGGGLVAGRLAPRTLSRLQDLEVARAQRR